MRRVCGGRNSVRLGKGGQFTGSRRAPARLLLPLALALLLALTGCRPGSVWSPDSQQLVVEAHESLYLFRLKSKTFEKLKTGTGQSLNAGWSPDGKRLAYYRLVSESGKSSSLALSTLDLETEKETVLASQLELPEGERQEPGFPEAQKSLLKQLISLCWSPDGRQIAFVSYVKGRGTLTLVPAAGGSLKRWAVPDANVHSPTWSPDGSQVAFFAEPYGKLGPGGLPAPRGRIEVRVALPGAGTNRRVWLPPPGSDLNPVPYGPQWDRDGKGLSIVAEKSGPAGEGLPAPPGLGMTSEIWRVPLKGSAKKVAETPGVPLFTSVSPDCKQVIYFRTTQQPEDPLVVGWLTAPFGEARTLFEIPSLGAGRVPGKEGDDSLTQKPPQLVTLPVPILSPDGKYVAVSLEEEGKAARLWLASTADGKAEQFTVPDR